MLASADMHAARTTLRLLLAAIAILAAVPGQAQIGGNPTILPPSAILTNYDRVLIGQEEPQQQGGKDGWVPFHCGHPPETGR